MSAGLERSDEREGSSEAMSGGLERSDERADGEAERSP